MADKSSYCQRCSSRTLAIAVPIGLAGIYGFPWLIHTYNPAAYNDINGAAFGITNALICGYIGFRIATFLIKRTQCQTCGKHE
jgi:hypothetical protein